MSDSFKLPKVNGNKITVYSSKTCKAESMECDSKGILTIFKNLIKYSTTNDPNIRFNKNEQEKVSEIWQMNENVYAACGDLDVYTGLYRTIYIGSNGKDILSKYNTLIEHYTSENSIGGKDVTQEEVCLMAEKLFNWYKNLNARVRIQ